MNSTKQHMPFIDVFRGVAIFAVFLFHCLGAVFGVDRLPWRGFFRDFDADWSFLLLYPLTYGWAGVAFFFVISGFCIHLSYLQGTSKGWSSFFIRRLFRIFPAYLLAIGLFFFVWPWGQCSVGSLDRLLQLVTHVLAIHNIDQRTFFGINPSFWSIAVEVQLYLIYPLLLLLVGRLGWKGGLLIVGLVEIAIRTFISVYGLYSSAPLPTFLTASPFAYWLSWALGAYLAECYLENRRSRLFAVRLDVVVLFALLIPLFKPLDSFAFLAFAWLAAIVIDRCVTGVWYIPEEGGSWQLLWRHFKFLGMVSYSFYLFHQPILWLSKLVVGVHPLLNFAICLLMYPLLLLLSFFVYKLVEVPSISLGRRVLLQAKKS